MKEEIKRLFFGFEVHAPWPQKFPSGRMIAEAHRHLTVAFLGNVPSKTVAALLPSLPTPPFEIGPAGLFDECLFLPKRHPHVVAWNVDWLPDESEELLAFQRSFCEVLYGHHLLKEPSRDFLSHVTLCRSPFSKEKWQNAFQSLPLYIKDFHLYESVGNLIYKPCWSYPMAAPFDEISHTADLAFLVRGKNLQQLYRHAQLALAFYYPPIRSFFPDNAKPENVDELIILLNEGLSKADASGGVPFKAVSFHGEVIQRKHNLLEWEMIVDV